MVWNLKEYRIKCLECENKFYPLAVGTKVEKKYCSKGCGARARQRERYRQGKIKPWSQMNRLAYNEAMKRNYNQNKLKWMSRTITNKFLKEMINIDKILERKCKQCKTPKNLEIHHEIYPIRYGQIIDAILDGKIYYLCKKHHRDLNRKLFKLKNKINSI